MLTLSIYRARNVGCFEPKHVKWMNASSGTLAASVDRHVAMLQPADLNNLDQLRKLIADIPRGSRFSDQETAVCARIITGHSTESIAVNLGISAHSVATYCRRGLHAAQCQFAEQLFLLLLGLCSRRPATGPGYMRVPIFAGRHQSGLALRQ